MDSKTPDGRSELWSQLGITADLRSSEDQTLWTCFGTFCAANAVLLVALFTSGDFPPNPLVGVLIGVVGAGMSFLWYLIQRRAIGYIVGHEKLMVLLQEKLQVPCDLAISAPMQNGPTARSLMTGASILATVAWCLLLVVFVAQAVGRGSTVERNAGMELALGLLGGLLLGVAASTVAWVISEYLARPLLRIEVDQDRAQGHLPSNPPHEFYHVRVANLPALWRLPGRRPAWACTATIEVFGQDGSRILNGEITGRWTSQPEPLLPVVSQGQVANVLDPARVMQARRIDVHAHATEAMSIALKFEGEPDCYIFTNESYVFPRWQNPAWRLVQGRYRVHVTVFYERGCAQRDFELRNGGPSRNDVRLSPWPTN